MPDATISAAGHVATPPAEVFAFVVVLEDHCELADGGGEVPAALAGGESS